MPNWRIMTFTLAEIAEALEADLIGDGNKTIHGPAPFDSAGPDDITFAGSGKYINRLGESRAGAVIVPRDTKTAPVNLVAVKNPQAAFDQFAAFVAKLHLYAVFEQIVFFLIDVKRGLGKGVVRELADGVVIGGIG